MLLTESNRFSINPNEIGGPIYMTKNGSVVEDMEEGEISDDSISSIEEISEEVFKQEADVVVVKKSKPKEDESRVWMGREDLMNYSVSKNYGSNLHNFAWAQGVQNKPLITRENVKEDLVVSDEKMKRESPDNVSLTSKDDDDDKPLDTVVIDDSSEEGELEEGEIDLDVEKTEDKLKTDNLDKKFKVSEFDDQIRSIREALVTINVLEAEKSFIGACSLLWRCLERLELMLEENRVPEVEALFQQSFNGIQALNSVFSSMTVTQKEQNRTIFQRLLAYVKSRSVDIFPSECMKEVDSMLCILDSQCGVSSVKGINKETEVSDNNRKSLTAFGALVENRSVHGLNSLKKLNMEAISGSHFERNMGSESLKYRPFSGSRGNGNFGPLFDLHKEHDPDNLPSPTSKIPPPPLSMKQTQVVTDKVLNSDKSSSNIADKRDDVMMHLYETDAFRAVSTYQQKFGQTSFLSNNRLPSPTPSEEIGHEDGDNGQEVSSSFVSISPQPFAPTLSHVNSANEPKAIIGKIAQTPASGWQPPVLSAPTKNRDPRLQFANAEVVVRDSNNSLLNVPLNQQTGGVMSSRKHIIAEESVLDGRSSKRRRNGFTGSDSSREAQVASPKDSSMVQTQGAEPVSRNQLAGNMEIDNRKVNKGETGTGGRHMVSNIHNINVRTGVSGQPITSNTISLPSSIKDIAVNPTMLMDLFKEQQRLMSGGQQNFGHAQKATPPTDPSSILGTIPLLNVASSKSSETEQKHITVPRTSQGESRKIRMKPRDPRRVLHKSTFQQNEISKPEQLKTNDSLPQITRVSKDSFPIGLIQPTSSPLPSAPQADIIPQIAKNVQNVLPSQPILDKVDRRVGSTGRIDQQSDNCAKISQLQNVWGEMDQLFGRYDDQDKAAIQRERTRRIEEQNKMFAAKKLCLVLDIDHTLLNSAKFVEVDPVHQEMLRIKELQDREKPKRHLFRFPHMGMWTKLRPGIWNFLERASKLYELHIYTMGNKRYATEMAKLIDPTGSLFAGRVISRGDDGDSLDGEDRVPKSKDLDGVLGMESAIVIIDDSVRVWPHHRPNLIAVERYIYFPCSRRQFGLHGPSLLEIDHDERPEDGTLASCLAVIERIHKIFYSHQCLNDPDVRTILNSEQRKILAGCRVLFSTIIPVGEAKPELHPLWQTAEQFGAVCTNQIDEAVTHVVTNTLGTNKVNWGLMTGRFVVHPGWVEASALLYRRANEIDFAIKP